MLPTTAMLRTLLFNIHECCWDKEILQWFDIPESILPEVKDSSGYFGTTVEGLFRCWNSHSWNSWRPASGALFGQGCIQPTMAKNTYGTGCFMLMNTGNVPVNRVADY